MASTEDKGGFVGRGGLKLEAALQALGGTGRIRGAQALDIGASTGGFTECLLRHGARQVTAVEVGHGQLHERVRSDPRVVNLERTNFKTVSLKVAPGPFDFFVIDVSFVAARTMLRPLAFRLKPGAEGFILVKPQFELPDRFVHDGKVATQRLRDWALQRVRGKGAELGFRMLASADSPVALESGTVELLTRWRFEGPTGKITGEPAPPSGAKPAPGPAQRSGTKRPETRRPQGKRPAWRRPEGKRPESKRPEPSRPEPKRVESRRSEAKLPFEVPELPVKKPRRPR